MTRRRQSGTEPEVIDDFAAPMPITAAELDVIETYLADVLHDVFAAPGSIRAGNQPDRREMLNNPDCRHEV